MILKHNILFLEGVSVLHHRGASVVYHKGGFYFYFFFEGEVEVLGVYYGRGAYISVLY